MNTVVSSGIYDGGSPRIRNCREYRVCLRHEHFAHPRNIAVGWRAPHSPSANIDADSCYLFSAASDELVEGKIGFLVWGCKQFWIREWKECFAINLFQPPRLAWYPYRDMIVTACSGQVLMGIQQMSLLQVCNQFMSVMLARMRLLWQIWFLFTITTYLPICYHTTTHFLCFLSSHLPIYDGIYQILLPSIFLHGTFDFILFLMGAVEFIYESPSLIFEVTTLVVAGCVSIGGAVWAYKSFSLVQAAFDSGWQVMDQEEREENSHLWRRTKYQMWYHDLIAQLDVAYVWEMITMTVKNLIMIVF